MLAKGLSPPLATKNAGGRKGQCVAWFVLIVCANLCFNALFVFLTTTSSFQLDTTVSLGTNTEAELQSRLKLFNEVNSRLVNYGRHNSSWVNPPDSCGTVHSEAAQRDCLRAYDVWDILQSDQLGVSFEPEMQAKLEIRREEAKKPCSSRQYTETGGWCLVRNPTSEYNITAADGKTFSIPHHHVPAGKRVVTELSSLILDENITSINDFGAGVGQFKDALVNQVGRFAGFVYNAYDGAGNIEEYTHGFVKFFDLTLPLELPRTDWVLSLEVGEHVPNRFEGMVIRNLHHHNCRGIILSWAILDQGGNGHVNNHSNDYLRHIMEEMGYVEDVEWTKRLRNPQDNYYWFVKSIMMFRRRHPVC